MHATHPLQEYSTQMKLTKYSIPLIEPYLGKKSRLYINECFDTKWISSRGHFIKDFEEAFAKFVGTKYAVAVSNGTTALHLALMGFGIGEGDEVVVPDLTFAATINAVLHARATPIIVDVDPHTWNISPNAIRKVLTKKTKAIIPVHLYGYPADMDKILAIAQESNLFIIEDSAEAHGATLKNRMLGSIGHCGAFSFYGNKIITTGEGGMVTLNDESIYEKMLVLRDHGMNKDNRYRYDVVGYNYRMTNPQAALGLSQLLEIEEILSYRRMISNWYVERLKSLQGIQIRSETSEMKSVNWIFTCLANNRDQVMQKLEEENIESRPMFYPLHEMDIYHNYCRGSYDASVSVSYKGISLPTYYGMPESYIDRVCSAVRKSLV
jgi:perosamine synthetase